ncbi:MAG: outer membrane protein assembly factor BamE [Candidatus Symbiobacter sp.]|nr:outer membrane protein assembly factor BamE [Candidatus Symbiobacter sp.]
MPCQKGTCKRIAKLVGLVIVAGMVVGCKPNIQRQGKLADPEAVALLRTGLSRSDIVDLLGTPSSKDPFDPRVWYYISRQTRAIAFWDPSVLDQAVVKIRFDATDHVASIDQKIGTKDLVDISPNSRQIPSQGHSLGVLTQIFGNIGRFSGKAAQR